MATSPRNRLYTDEEAKRIFEHALRLDSRDAADKLRHDELLAAAREVGIDEQAVERAVIELELDDAERQVRRDIIQARRRGLGRHLVVFVAVNLFLAALNLLTQPGIWWCLFPLLGWGLGLFFHAWVGLSRRIHPKTVKRKLKRLGLPHEPNRQTPTANRPSASRSAQLLGETVDEGVATILELVRDELRAARKPNATHRKP